LEQRRSAVERSGDGAEVANSDSDSLTIAERLEK
jgi:hypothetical protein